MVVAFSSQISKISLLLLPGLISWIGGKDEKEGESVGKELILFILTLGFVVSFYRLFQFNTTSSVTNIQSYNGAEQGRSLKLWMSQHLHGHLITIWALSNQLAVTMVTAAPSHVIAIHDFPCWLPIKSMGKPIGGCKLLPSLPLFCPPRMHCTCPQHPCTCSICP